MSSLNRMSVILLVVVLVSSFFVITIRHKNRLAFIQLQKHEEMRDQLQTRWGQLMLEKATWSIEHNIAEDARTRLSMSPPPPEKIITVQLGKLD
jgi:cell division protein FtsL